jgi:hypothetical protein
MKVSMQINQRAVHTEVDQTDKNKKAATKTESLEQTNKKQLNAAILQGAIDQADKSSSSVKDQPLALVLKTALQGINDALKEIEPNQSLQQSYDSEVDFSPQATADRIVAFSTNFFSSYQEQHPELSEQEARDTFSDLMLAGVKEGIGEAKDILKALSVLDGDIAWRLYWKGLISSDILRLNRRHCLKERRLTLMMLSFNKKRCDIKAY